MSSALYRTDDGDEFTIQYLPRGYTAPATLTLVKDLGTLTGMEITFRYVGDGKCDKYMAHGAGHQSVSRCDQLGTHDEHHVEGGSGDYYWTDKDMVDTPTGPGFGGNKQVERYGPKIAYSRW